MDTIVLACTWINCMLYQITVIHRALLNWPCKSIHFARNFLSLAILFPLWLIRCCSFFHPFQLLVNSNGHNLHFSDFSFLHRFGNVQASEVAMCNVAILKMQLLHEQKNESNEKKPEIQKESKKSIRVET